MEIVINDFVCPSLNELMHKSWRVHQQMMKQVKELAAYTMMEQVPARKRSEWFKGCYPLRVSIAAYFKGKRRRDVDNLYVKPIIDALVATKILPDDNCEIVYCVELWVFRESDSDRVVITIN